MARMQQFLFGCRDSMTMILGIAPVGLIFGALAVLAGLSVVESTVMSVLVYAGSAQFIALSLIAASSGLLVVLLTTFVVNLRHVLYSAALKPYVGELSKRWRIPLAFTLTDETFAVVQRRYLVLGKENHGRWYHAGVTLTLYITWTVSSLLGALFGQSVPDLAGWGLEFTMLATFIGIVVPALRNRPQIAAAVVAGGVALICHFWPYKLGLMAAAVSGIATGVLLQRREERAHKENV
jgi:4-azaleucine resistance transporter AzlC